MAKRRSEVVAASQLSNWTDADTAMQIVGSSLGVFGAGQLEPTTVLSNETPLRNALFDVLLSLVEGGALEIRVAPGNRYAFRWRADIAVSGVAPDNATAIDLAVPSPYLAELERLTAERDDAVVRAELAEALAAERERLLRLADVPSPAEPRVVGRARAVPGLDTRDESVLDVLYSQPLEPAVAPAAKPATRKPATRKPAARKPPEKAPADKPAAEKAPRKPARAKAAPKPAATSDVLYLTPPEAEVEPDIDLTLEEPRAARRPKWSGYAIDRPRQHLSSVDRLVEDG
jgi:hypothetical protein